MVRFAFEGETAVSRGKVKNIYPPSEDILVQWHANDGAKVTRGDPLVIFSTELLRRRIPIKRLQVSLAEKQLVYNRLKLDERMKDLLAEKKKLEADLAVKRASIQSVKFKDRPRSDLLHEQFVLAERDAEQKESEARKQQELFKLGQVAQEKVIDAHKDSELAAVKTRVPEIEWKLASGQIDLIKVERLELEVLRLRTELGRDAKESGPSKTRGIEAEIGAMKENLARKHKGILAEKNRAARALHKVIRDSADHTPITWIEFQDGEGKSILKANFQPAGSAVPQGFRPDSGQPYTENRGYGWDRDVSGMFFERKKELKPESSVGVIEGMADWRCRIAAGPCKMRLKLGDRVDWDGALVRINGETVFYEPRIKAGKFKIVEHEFEVTEGFARVTFGDAVVKAVRAQFEGVFTLEEWNCRPGSRVRRTTWPVGYLALPEDFRIQARVPQNLVPLLKVAASIQKPGTGAKKSLAEKRTLDAGGKAGPGLLKGEAASAASQVTSRLNRAKRKLATSKVRFFRSDGRAISAMVDKIRNEPVTLFRSVVTWVNREDQAQVKDKIAREVFLKPAGEGSKGLRLKENSHCRCEISLPEGMYSIPVHLVMPSGNTLHVQVKGQGEKEVLGFRAGDCYVILEGLRQGQELIVFATGRKLSKDSGPSFIGEVIPDKRTEVHLEGWGFGRIKEMVPDGSHVKDGQIVVTLYNRELDKMKEKNEEKRLKANQEFLEAAEERRVKGVKESLVHRENIIGERLARNQVKQAYEDDPLILARAENAYEIARLQERHKVSRFELIHKSQASLPARVAPARFAAETAKIESQKRQLRYVSAVRHRDWISLLGAKSAWRDAVEALGLWESSLQLARLEEQVARMRARLKLEQALDRLSWESEFDRFKDIRARATGRLFYLKGWNDQTNEWSTFQKDFIVFGSFPIAEVLDMSYLAFRVEIPENYYGKTQIGQEVMIDFEQFGHRKVEGRVKEIGKKLFVPREMVDEESGQQPVSNRRVFVVTLAFTSPDDLKELLIPGTKGKALWGKRRGSRDKRQKAGSFEATDPITARRLSGPRNPAP